MAKLIETDQDKWLRYERELEAYLQNADNTSKFVF